MCAERANSGAIIPITGYPTLELRVGHPSVLADSLVRRSRVRVRAPREGFRQGERVILRIAFDSPEDYILPLHAMVTKIHARDGGGADLDLSLSPASALQFREALEFLPARRTADVCVDPSRQRKPVDARAECYVASLWQRLPARVVDVSDSGAFLAIGAPVARGDFLWFRSELDEDWHGATVCWSGQKSDNPGVGVEIAFRNKIDRRRWAAYLRELRGIR